MMSTYIRYPASSGNGISTYATSASLPASATDGATAITLDTDTLYIYNLASTTWEPVASPATIFGIGTIDSQTASSNGAVVTSNNLVLQSASSTKPGLVNNTTQSFSGNKTFTGTIAASNLSGTNTGDVSLTAVGSTPSANGASLSGQALTLQAADATHPGLITATTQTIGGDKTLNGTLSITSSGSTGGDFTVGSSLGVTGAASFDGGLVSTDGFGALSISGVFSADLGGVMTDGHGGMILTGNLSAANISGSVSGVNTGDQTITLTGDVTGTGTGSFATAIGLQTVTNAKLAQMNLRTLKGNNTGGLSPPVDLTVAQVNAMLGTFSNPLTTLGDIIYEDATPTPVRLAGNITSTTKFLTQTGTGSVSAAPGWNTISAADVPTLNQNTTGTAAKATAPTSGSAHGAVTLDLSGNFQSVAPASAGNYLRSNGTDFVGSSIQVSDVPTLNQNTTGTSASVTGANVVTNSNLAQMSANTIKGNNTGSTANAADLTAAQARALLGLAPTIQRFTSGSGTYTTPAGVLYLKVKVLGGGGGGQSGGSTRTAGTAGNSSTVSVHSGAAFITAGGGAAGSDATNASGGGTSITTSATVITILTANGGSATGSTAVTAGVGYAPCGSNSYFGGGGAGGVNGSVGFAGSTNTGGGGGGGNAGSGNTGGAGAAGGYAEVLITSPSASYDYSVGGTAAGGSASGTAGGAGAAGLIVFEEYYQ